MNYHQCLSNTFASSYLIYSLHHQIPLFLHLALLLLILLYPIINLLSIYYLSSYPILQGHMVKSLTSHLDYSIPELCDSV